MFMFLFLFFSMLLLYSFFRLQKRIISSEKWGNYVVTIFFENAKNLGRSDDGKWRKKGGWPYVVAERKPKKDQALLYFNPGLCDTGAVL